MKLLRINLLVTTVAFLSIMRVQSAATTTTPKATTTTKATTSTATSTAKATTTKATTTTKPPTTTSAPTTAKPLTKKLVFEDNFDTFNKSTWNQLITSWRGGLSQFQWYTNSTNNSYVQNGFLHIVPTLTADVYGNSFLYNGTLNLTAQGCNYIGPENFSSSCLRKGGLNGDIINPIMSARLHSTPSFNFLYGQVDVRAKLSRGDWLWPSIFLMPTDLAYGPWPQSGEIDMVEIHANDNMTCNGTIMDKRRAKATLHWGTNTTDYADKTGYIKTLTNGDDYAKSFHNYSVLWNQTGIYYSIDGVSIGGVTPPAGGFYKLSGSKGPNFWANGTHMAPYDKRFFIILKVAAGGDYFPEGCLNYPNGVNSPKPWNKSNTVQMKPFWEAKNQWLPTWNSANQDTHMIVDYVRVYQFS